MLGSIHVELLRRKPPVPAQSSSKNEQISARVRSASSVRTRSRIHDTASTSPLETRKRTVTTPVKHHTADRTRTYPPAEERLGPRGTGSAQPRLRTQSALPAQRDRRRSLSGAQGVQDRNQNVDSPAFMRSVVEDQAVDHQAHKTHRVIETTGDVRWVPDEEVPKCDKCFRTFSFLLRRHHCRRCGNVFCADCSNHMLALPTHGYHSPVRVCDDCFQAEPKPSHEKLNENSQAPRRVRWQRDEEVHVCPLCAQEFSFFYRKHHCRQCGRIVCEKCSPHKKELKELGYSSSQRVCNTCVHEPIVPTIVSEKRSSEEKSKRETPSNVENPLLHSVSDAHSVRELKSRLRLFQRQLQLLQKDALVLAGSLKQAVADGNTEKAIEIKAQLSKMELIADEKVRACKDVVALLETTEEGSRVLRMAQERQKSQQSRLQQAEKKSKTEKEKTLEDITSPPTPATPDSSI